MAEYPFPEDCGIRRVVACPWCASTRGTELAKRDRYGWGVTPIACECCGLIWLDTVFTLDGIRRFYAQHYRPLVTKYHGKPKGYTWDAESKAHYAMVRAHVPFLDGRVLDIGGLGGHGETLNPERGGGLLETFAPDGPYDTILCAQTLDHLADPRLAWQRFAAWTRPGGTLWVDAVNAEKIRNWKFDHPTNWTPATLHRVIQETGQWEVRWAGHLPDNVHYGVRLQRKTW